jgi:F-type H+-transporting ATPase subunit a
MRYMFSAVVTMASLSALLTFSGGFSLSDLAAAPNAAGDQASTDAGEHGAVDFDFLSILTHHLMDSVIFEWQIGGTKIRPGDEGYENPKFVRRYTFKDEQGLYRYAGGLPMHITRRVMMMMIVAGILMLVVVAAARRIAANPTRINGKLPNALEAGFLWVRKDLVEEGMHGHSRSYEHLILSLFFFIFLCNLAGLFPPIGEGVVKAYEAITHTHHDNHSVGTTEHPLIAVWPGVTATGDISVTFALALIPTLMMWGIGFKYQGFKFLWHSVPNGVPLALFPIMWILEFVVSPIAKGFALTIRLLANMTGGHVIILALVGFIFQVKLMWFGGPVGVVGAAGITLASLGGAIAIYFLEILVSFLQAFIFAMLTALFVGSVMHRH